MNAVRLRLGLVCDERRFGLVRRGEGLVRSDGFERLLLRDYDRRRRKLFTDELGESFLLLQDLPALGNRDVDERG